MPLEAEKMQFKKPNSCKAEDLINKYKNRTSAELRTIVPRWAISNDTDKLFDRVLDPLNGRYCIINVNLLNLVKISEFGEFDLETLFNGNLVNDYRISNLLLRWESGFFVDPPSVFLTVVRDKVCVSFSDGRHRTKLAYHLGSNSIPVAVDVDNLINFQSLLSDI